MGGEKVIQLEREKRQLGSPPHGRGKGVGAARIGCGVGITPAWAGKRSVHPDARSDAGDHPRIGGEKFHSAAEIDEKMGSPPHRRGKVIVNLILTKGHRITPAQAGKGQE